MGGGAPAAFFAAAHLFGTAFPFAVGTMGVTFGVAAVGASHGRASHLLKRENNLTTIHKINFFVGSNV